jgi:uncharacterized protein with PQ loop repeat
MRHTFHPKHKIKKNGKIDALALFVGITQPIATLPQIYIVYASQDASSVSLIMWAWFDVSSIVLLMYGLRHKLAPIVWAQSLWLIVQTPMVIAALLFR